ncbi:uncharacterized protein LOC120110395 [Phoenix dactylifera]|uniref:Uncharacterized protein LOC120110395 n=1 Tax=Phoenix dactylifera TaxID=42345 RepID=A0A8B9A3D8_PHODC|nr:uncharacterized protein LOC120110395 [Phoenix dactylifera]
MADNQDNQNKRLLSDYAVSNVNGAQPSIVRPTVNANNFEIKPGLIQMVQQEQFGGGPVEDPHAHLANFLEICDTIKMNGCIDAVAEGTLMSKPTEEAYELLEEMASNNYQWSNERGMPKKVPGMYDVDGINMLNAKVDSLAGGIIPTFHGKIKVTKVAVLDLPIVLVSNQDHPNQKDNLLSKTEINPKEHCKAVTLRSGKQLRQVSGETVVGDEVDYEEVSKKVGEEVEDLVRTTSPLPLVEPYIPSIPFSQRLKQNKIDQQFENFLKVFRQLHINILFADALAQISAYTKFLKEIIFKKRKLEDFETITLMEKCSAIIQNKLPPKLRDPESFSISCTIGDVDFSRALCDLGASISLMPLFVSRKLGLKESKPTTISLQLAD